MNSVCINWGTLGWFTQAHYSGSWYSKWVSLDGRVCIGNMPDDDMPPADADPTTGVCSYNGVTWVIKPLDHAVLFLEG